jgi:hypothetical protein
MDNEDGTVKAGFAGQCVTFDSGSGSDQRGECHPIGSGSGWERAGRIATHDERAALHGPPARMNVTPIFYPASGCVPQSGPSEPPVWVTCVSPVPSTLTV